MSGLCWEPFQPLALVHRALTPSPGLGSRSPVEVDPESWAQSALMFLESGQHLPRAETGLTIAVNVCVVSRVKLVQVL